MIDFYKASIDKNPDWKVFNFNFSPTNTYNSIDEFYREVEEQGYSIMFTEIDKAYIDKLISEGKLYLFKIFNKDFSEYSKGKSNLHTLYWKALFEEENLRNVVYKLNGGAEIFFRESSIEKEEIVIHKANEEIKNKNPLSTKTHSTFPYDLIKDRRYTYDHFQFHVPITLNFKSRRINNINPDVLKYLKENKEVNIIGIDRGERNLIYMTIINQNGEILHQESLNYFRDEQKDIVKDYHALLVNREKERDQARRNWGAIEKIKDLKEGYISQIIHKIASLMVQYNAILVMEDLNIGFKRGRFKVERQVYQKFEKMLIDKLNYLVFKDKSDNEPGGRYNALQLTNHVTTLGEVGKQCGFLFYVPAWNTSKIDPTTGFVNFFKTRYESVEKSKEFFSRFDSIRYNAERDYFEFVFDYSQFTAKAEGTKTHWTVCTYGERILTFRNPENNHQWDYKKVSLTEELSQLLRKFHIDFKDGNCLKNKISGISDSEFFRKLIHLFGLTMQMRNSNSNDGEDFIISPVKNLDGNFYLTQNKGGVIPEDADANGAYHIAKKGLWWLEQINKFSGTDWKKLKFDISNKGWLQFAQKHTLTLNG
jgi:CRISPR-associated protein Cpf1